MEEENRESWHLSKTVNISHIVTTVVLVVGMVTYIGEIERQVAIQKVEIVNIKTKMDKQISTYDSLFERIDRKLDKMYELLSKKAN